MRSLYGIAAIGIVALTTVCGVDAQIVRRRVVVEEVKKTFGFKLENTHSRSYADPSGKRCDLTDEAEGVIWRVICQGEGIDAEDVVIEDEKGREFKQTCWSSQGTVYELDNAGNRVGGGPQTEFLAIGPDDSKKLKITYGEVTAEVVMK